MFGQKSSDLSKLPRSSVHIRQVDVTTSAYYATSKLFHRKF